MPAMRTLEHFALCGIDMNDENKKLHIEIPILILLPKLEDLIELAKAQRKAQERRVPDTQMLRRPGMSRVSRN